MKKKNASIYVVGGLANKIAPFLLLPVITSYLSADDFGVISIFFSIIAICLVINSILLESTIIPYYKKYSEVIFKKAITIILLFSTIIFLFLLAFSWLIYLLNIYSEYLILVFFIPLCSYLQTVINIYLQIKRAEEMAIELVLFQFLNNTLIVILSYYLIAIIKMNYLGRLYPVVFVNFLFALYALFSIRKYIVLDALDREISKRLISFSLPLIPHKLFKVFRSDLDKIVIGYIFGLQATGVYSLGKKLSSGINIISYSVNYAFSPNIFDLLKARNYLKVNNTLRNLSYFTGIISIFYIGFLLFYENYFANQSYEGTLKISFVFLLIYALRAFYMYYANTVFYSERTSVFAKLTIYSVSIYIGGIFLTYWIKSIFVLIICLVFIEMIYATVSFKKHKDYEDDNT